MSMYELYDLVCMNRDHYEYAMSCLDDYEDSTVIYEGLHMVGLYIEDVVCPDGDYDEDLLWSVVCELADDHYQGVTWEQARDAAIAWNRFRSSEWLPQCVTTQGGAS